MKWPHILFFSLILSLPAWGKTVRVVYIGDSVTAGYGIDSQKAYPWLVQKKLKDKKLETETVNASISGSLSSSAEGRVKWQLKQKPDIIVLALGGNDGLKGTPAKEIQTHLQKAVDLALANKIIVVLAGFKMFANLGETYTSQFAAIYTNMAKQNKNIIAIPFLLEGVGADPKMNIADGKHPNEKGHQKIAETVAPYIEKAVERATASAKNP